MKILPLLLLALLAGATGCAPVFSTHPVGQRPLNLKEEAAEWAGSWSDAEGRSFLISLEDAEQGRLRLTFVEEDGVNLRSETIEVRETGSARFFNAKDRDHPAPPRWLWARMDREGRRILVWLPSNEAVKECIDKGELAGTAPKADDILLGELSEEQQLRLARPDATLYRWDKPLVYFKTSK